ncbi:hypothetical protein LXA43DRAFT_1090279 [Ganoderma leucocontextum]|nr:hypothetical protein LXA43DRAFT_1090279 [Ganoderma leucocontextum]
MSEPMNLESSVPTGQVAPEEASCSKEPLKDAREADAEFLALLADTQNACLEELGYSSTLLLEFQELKRECATLHQQRIELQNQCNLLRADNTKLYADNRSLATFIQQQDQRMMLLQDPNDQQKRTITDLHESVRRLATERDELAGRLHAALNEVVVLRQELARFVPNAMMVSPRERMPSGGGSVPPPTQRGSSHPIHPSMAPVHVPINMAHFQNALMAKEQIQPGARPPQPLHQHRGSVPTTAPVNITAQLPPISQHRRPSAPALLITGQPGFMQSPISASPINNFSGLTLAGSNPPTPATSRPSTATGQLPIFSQSAPPSRPASSRGGSHMHPPVPHRSSSSSLAGAIIDLTGDDNPHDGVRKKRKLEHPTPPVAGPSSQTSGSINRPLPAASGGLNGMGGQMSPAEADIPRLEMPPTSHPHYQHSTAVGSASAVPPLAVAAEQQVGIPPSAQPQPLPAPVPVPVQDVVMEEEAVQQEQQTTVEEDCLEANFDEDEADETKKWCRMCRSVWNDSGGHTTEAPTPFINAWQQVLIEHCEQVHPRGWEILKTKVAEERAAEDAEV